MDAPTVQYVRTSDGWNIACSVAGEGRTLLTMPYPFSHATLSWTAPGLCEVCVLLSQKFRVVHFDARGQGLSSRGLDETHQVEDYVLDLDAVMGTLSLERFVLFSGVAFWKAAVAFAAKNPNRLSALILLNPSGSVTTTHRTSSITTQVATNWDTYLLTAGSTFNPAPANHAERLQLREHMRQCVEQADYLKMHLVNQACDVREWLASIRTPTLVIRQQSPWDTSVSSDIAAAVFGAKLRIVDDYGSVFYSAAGETPPGIRAIEEFLAELEDVGASRSQSSVQRSALSARELDVLRLLAAGRSNQQIADELVISLNTVRRHVSNIFDKAGVANRTEASVYARNRGLA